MQLILSLLNDSTVSNINVYSLSDIVLILNSSVQIFPLLCNINVFFVCLRIWTCFLSYNHHVLKEELDVNWSP